MTVQREDDVRGLREAGRVVRRCLDEMSRHVRPGITTRELNRIGAELLRLEQARSAPMLVYGFPAEICISVNHEIVHGIPSDRRLENGDLLKLDVTVEKGGYMADAAITVGVGEVSPERAALAECARQAFQMAMRVARAGRRLNEIGRAVEAEAQRCGFSVVRALSGHGIGRTIHESPTVPNYDDPDARERLSEGLVLTVEPILSTGSGEALDSGDGWTIVTADGAPAAHYEQTLVITADRPLLLTDAA